MKLVTDLEEGTRYPATLRGVDNQILANGEALFYRSRGRGIFQPLPLGTAIHRSFPIALAIVQILPDGLQVTVRNVSPCQGGPHLDFDL